VDKTSAPITRDGAFPAVAWNTREGNLQRLIVGNEVSRRSVRRFVAAATLDSEVDVCASAIIGSESGTD
jgi:hypothetical protein